MFKNQTIFNYIAIDHKKSKYSSNTRVSLNLQTIFYEKLYIKQTSTAATNEFLSKIPNRKKISNEHFNICEAEISLDVS